MKKHIPLCLAIFAGLNAFAQGQDFETANEAVANMRIGWNVGNRLDSNSGSTQNMWIEAWSDRSPASYETAWGQKQITKELIKMFKNAGFNAIRVPVTWYPHYGNVIVDPSQTNWQPIWDNSTWTGYEMNRDWMDRVHEVVDYVIDEGMYCILNVHHDTGDGDTAWLRADMEVYQNQKERFETLWAIIAEEFKDYGEKLLFEGYNEMLDSYGSWCFASFATPGNYNADVATSAYSAINSYAQSFVNTVRATGGNNQQRNLICSTYGACCGEGTWSSHLTEPLKQMAVPEDVTDGHLCFEVHSYPTPKSNSQAKSVVDNLVSVLKTNLIPKGLPVILGEWGIGSDDCKPYFNTMAEYMVSRCKEENIATFMWMVLADGEDCSVPQWTNPDLKDAVVRGYYGEEGYGGIGTAVCDESAEDSPYYNMMGIRIDHPTTPGLYIHNGKKIILQ